MPRRCAVADRVLACGFGLLRGVALLMVLAMVVALTPAVGSEPWARSQGAQWLAVAMQGIKPLLPPESHSFFRPELDFEGHPTMCGIVGAISKSPVNQLLYDALLLLQHRGQDAAGIVTMQGTKCFMHKARGMVRDVFRTRNMRALPGNVGLGQVRYPTAGNAWSEEEAQPFYVNAPFGIVLVHNGNLTNTQALKSELFQHRPPAHQHRERHRGADQHPGARSRGGRARPAADTARRCLPRWLRCTSASRARMRWSR